MGVTMPKTYPHLRNLNEDPLMSELLVYYIQEGDTLVGQPESPVKQDIQLSGIEIMDQHGVFNNKDGLVTYVLPLLLFIYLILVALHQKTVQRFTSTAS